MKVPVGFRVSSFTRIFRERGYDLIGLSGVPPSPAVTGIVPVLNGRNIRNFHIDCGEFPKSRFE